MNVLVVFTYDYSIRTWSESGTFLKEIEIYKLLAEKGINFTFLTYSESEPNFDILENNNIKVISIYEKIKKSKYKKINYFKSFLIPFRLKKDLDNIDLIKQNQLLGSWVAIILKYILKKPLLIRTGYDMYEFSLKEDKSFLIKFLYKFLTKISLKHSDMYTVSSKSDINFLRSNFNIENKTIEIRPNWVKEINYQKLEKRYENKIISIGRLENQKNFEFLISSFANTEYEIDIVGEGNLLENLKKFAFEKQTKVNFLGKLENNEVLNLLTKYRYYISTSKFEGNPKSTLEALSAGCIVFLSDIPNHSELIKHKSSGFIFSTSEDLYQIFKESLKKDLDKISKNAMKSVIRNNSIEKISNQEFIDYKSL